MSLHTCDGTFEGDRNCFVCGPGLEQQDKIDALQANTDSSPRRILELELEVKRLREALDPGELHVLIAKFVCEDDRSPEWMRNLANRISGQALSTPPPALAEAYVRLRDACKEERMDEMLDALAEVERLEKGE